MNKRNNNSNVIKKSVFSRDGLDLSIIFTAASLSIFCLVFVFSASAFEISDSKTYFNMLTLNASFKLLAKTGAFVVAGFIVMMFLALTNYKNLGEKLPKWITAVFTSPLIYYVISCGFFIFIEIMKHVGTDVGGENGEAVLVGGGFLKKVNGAYRWINIPKLNIGFQPSEVAKLLLIIGFALIIYNAGMVLKHKRGIILYCILAMIPALCIFKFSSDLSSSIVVFGILFIMMFVAAPDWKNTMIIFAVMVFFCVAALFIVVGINKGKPESDIHPYQAKRIMAWIYPDEYPSTADQTTQALYAIGSGGKFGEGIGNSMQKIKKLPEAQNDMIFALICEELGLFGGFLVLILYFIMLLRMYLIAQNTDNLFDRMVVVGVISHIGLQVIINVCVVTRLFPNTGLPLPLVSSGGSSILCMYAEIGLVLNIGKSIERR